MMSVSDSINEVENKIKTTEEEIAKVGNKIEELCQKLTTETDRDEKTDLREEKSALQKEKNLLREEKSSLLKEKIILREKEAALQKEKTAENLRKANQRSYQWPPRSPISDPGTAIRIPPPSEGKNPVNQTVARKSPSTEEGKEEGLAIMNDDSTNNVYCSGNSVALNLLRLLEESIGENITELLQKATIYFLNVLKKQKDNHLFPQSNERLFTGAFCDALNSILPEGLAVCHQSCIGIGATHSDLSARCIKIEGTPTLMIAEGKVGDSMEIRKQTRGQISNELIRHRKLDKDLNGKIDFRPILLIALNYSFISIDLAFPSTSNGHMCVSGWVQFKEHLPPNRETFWTTKLANVHIPGESDQKKIATILSFISKALGFLSSLPESDVRRVQFKTPWLESLPSFVPNRAWKHGENVTVMQAEDGKRMVFKEYCYYLREGDNFNHINDSLVNERDQRRPPPQDLLLALGPPYDKWKVTSGPFRIKILVYEEILEDHKGPSLEGWLQVLSQVRKMHQLNYVHGDLLPRNLVFSGKSGNVIDFDLSRKEENETYVFGYNHVDFTEYRHPAARSRHVMSKVHDIHSLRAIGKEFFDLDEDLQANLENIGDIEALESFFSEVSPDLAKRLDNLPVDTATGSPNRADGIAPMEALSRAADDLTLH